MVDLGPDSRALRICWDSVTRRKQLNTVAIGDALEIVAEIESFFLVKNVLTPDEKSIVRKMAVEKPYLSLIWEELSSFLVSLTHSGTLLNFIRTRCKTTASETALLVENHRDSISASRAYLQPNLSAPLEKAEPFSDVRNNAPTRNSYRESWSPPNPPPRSGLAFEAKEQPTTDFWSKFKSNLWSRWTSISGLLAKSLLLRLLPLSRESQTRVKSEHTEDLLNRDRYSNRFERSRFTYGDYQTTSDETSRRASRASHANYRADDRQNDASYNIDASLSDLKRKIQYQDDLIARLERRAKGNILIFEEGKNFMLWISSARENETYKQWLVRLVSLILAFVLFMNALKIVYFIVLAYLLPKHNAMPYVYLPELEDDTVGFSLIQEFPRLEYMIYEVKEWLGV